MPVTKRLVQLSHLLAKDVSETINRELILDALFNMHTFINNDVLKASIVDLFGVDVPDYLLSAEVSVMQIKGDIIANTSSEITLSDIRRTELTKQKLEESTTLNDAFKKWISNIHFFEKLCENKISALKETIEPFLNRIFVIHGASCVKLLSKNTNTTEFDIKDIASDVAERYGKEKEFLKSKLPTIFSAIFQTERHYRKFPPLRFFH